MFHVSLALNSVTGSSPSSFLFPHLVPKDMFSMARLHIWRSPSGSMWTRLRDFPAFRSGVLQLDDVTVWNRNRGGSQLWLLRASVCLVSRQLYSWAPTQRSGGLDRALPLVYHGERSRGFQKHVALVFVEAAAVDDNLRSAPTSKDKVADGFKMSPSLSLSVCLSVL